MASSGRTQMRWIPVESAARKASSRPSGERRGQDSRVIPRGGRTSKRTIRGGSARRTMSAPSATAATTATAASAQARRSRLRRRAARPASGGCPADTPACEPPEAIHSSSSLTSWAVWMRSSGSLVRHCCTTRSSAGGSSGINWLGGAGWRSMMAAMRLAWLRPSKARLPVAIS